MTKSGKNRKPICLMILDGWGLSKRREGNAIALGNTPNMDNYLQIYPHTRLTASGPAVGLPDGQMGNSEVGHLNIGAGRVVYQELTRISEAIDNGDFYENPVLNKAFSDVAASNEKSIHLMGLVSDGGVHSHLKHLKALVNMAKSQGIKKLYIHAFLDGRDVPPRSAIGYLEELESYLRKKSIGKVATVSGRYFAMDRDNRWDRTRKAYDCLVYGTGKKFKSSVELIKNSYENNIDDEFVVPGIVEIDDDMGRIKNGDSVIFFNFRPDRARQMTGAFIGIGFTGFDRGYDPPDVNIVSMTLYNQKYDIPVAFPPQKIKDTLGEVISIKGLKQLRIAETEKYAHVTFFFNGGIELPYPGEDRILIPSPDIATYDKKPEMSANKVT
ncbi:MAG TPA: 2,3-bisphosphoglycerate-independent phosphoglycerate mutase, partial [Actinobacteria bacterium]|nr:2,3-bisphosphoglycerate-independent phosphoglycerate mutase [Actinomycetota bacterium]